MKTIKRNGVEISVEDEYTLVEGEELVEKTEEEEKAEVIAKTGEAEGGVPDVVKGEVGDDTEEDLDVPPEELEKEEE